MKAGSLFLLAFAASAGTAMAAPCESPRERAAWARERMYPGATQRQLEQVKTGLKLATDNCPTDGELWYLRSLVEAKLKITENLPIFRKRLEDYPVSAEMRSFNPLEAAPPVATEKRKVSPFVRDKWALLVGIEAFSDPSIPSLHYAKSDAVSLSKVLTGPTGRFAPAHVTVLTNEQATKTAILKALGEIREQAQEDDLVVVFISSHGLGADSDVTGVSYVVTADTDITSGATRYATALPMVELSDFSRRLKADRFVLMLDTCFGGGAIELPKSKAIRPLGDKPVDAFTGALHGMESGAGRAVIAASRSTEQSWESATFHQGYFTHFLMEALAQHEGKDNLNTVFSYLRDKVSDAVRNNVSQNQTPVMDHTDKGDEIIVGVEVKK